MTAIPSDWGDMAYLAKIAYATPPGSNQHSVWYLLDQSYLDANHIDLQYDYAPKNYGELGMAQSGTIPAIGPDAAWHFDPFGYYEATVTVGSGSNQVQLNAEAFVCYSSTLDEVVISFRGTEGFSNHGDILEDFLDVFLGGGPDTYSKLLVPLIAAVVDTYGSSANYVLNGHSLGGAIAEQYYGAMRNAGYHVRGFSFDGPGIDGATGHDPNFVHFSHSGDPIGLYRSNDHYGDSFIVDNMAMSGIIDEHTKYFYEDVAALSNSSLRGSITPNDVVASYATFNGNVLVDVDASFGNSFGRYTTIIGSASADHFSVTDAFSMKIDGLAGADVLIGGIFGDGLAGGSGNDTTYGGGGVDSISGDGGDDTLFGGAGGDRYSIGLGQGYDVVNDQGGDGIDTIAFSSGDIVGPIDPNWFHVSGSDFLIQVPDGHGGLALNVRVEDMASNASQIEQFDLLPGDGINVTASLNLADLWAEKTEPNAPPPPPPPMPPSPDDPFDFRGDASHTYFWGTDADEVAGGGDENDLFYGNGGDDFLLGQGGSDALYGGADNDIVVDDDAHGPYSADNLGGGAGDDTLVFFGAGNTPNFDYGDGGSGDDLALVDVRTRSEDWNLNLDGDTVEVGPESSGSSENEIHLDNFETVAVLFGNGDDSAYGGDEDDYFDGGDGEDHLHGNDGKDVLIGGSGDDRLFGGHQDWFDGGAGDDFAQIDLSSESTNLAFLEDQAMNGDGFTFADDTFVKNVEHFNVTTGSGDDQLWFGSGDIDVATNGGDDTVNTDGHGDETAEMGSGDDRVVVDYSWATTQVRSQLNSDHVTFWAYVGSSEALNTDHVVAIDAEEIVIKAGSSADHLFGGLGNDTFYGNDGNDQLDGKQGSNALYGGDGDDSVGSSGQDWIDGGDGIDRLSFDRSGLISITFDQAAASSAAGFTFVDGTFVKNVERAFIGLNGGVNVLRFTGHGQNSVGLDSGTNTVVVDFSWSTDAVSTTYDSGQFEWTAYSGASPYGSGANAVFIQGAGFSDWSFSARVIGGSGDDTIRGFRLDDVLTGGAGNDTLDGSDGSDTASYEDGASAVAVHLGIASAQIIGEGLGTDTLISIENLIGSGFGDRLFGNGAANVLSGGEGNDRLDGKGGRDVLIGGNGGDTLAGGGGRDSFAYSSVSESTGTSFDKLVGFDALQDRIDLAENVRAIDSEVAVGKLSNAHFDQNLENAIGTNELARYHAVLFTPGAGRHAGETFLIVDANGHAGYQAGEDYVFLLQDPANLAGLTSHNFT